MGNGTGSVSTTIQDDEFTVGRLKNLIPGRKVIWSHAPLEKLFKSENPFGTNEHHRNDVIPAGDKGQSTILKVGVESPSRLSTSMEMTTCQAKRTVSKDGMKKRSEMRDYDRGSIPKFA
ncbi:hypothetical protein RUM43_002934 [Polyplax serrata]|uniref:Uncharacterized protein n=1 Tax=Polyplax serrata TaxID=468196 RepID=A0AAN8PEN3_POLSC